MTEPLPGVDRDGEGGDGRDVQAARWSGALTDSGPWHAGSSLMGGLLLYGGLGWLLERWLGWPWLTAAGILLGMAAAVTSIWFRYGVDRSTGAATSAVAEQPQRAPHD